MQSNLGRGMVRDLLADQADGQSSERGFFADDATEKYKLPLH